MTLTRTLVAASVLALASTSAFAQTETVVVSTQAPLLGGLTVGTAVVGGVVAAVVIGAVASDSSSSTTN